jgi:hypothetical protein
MRGVPFRVHPLEHDPGGGWESVGFRSLRCVGLRDLTCAVRFGQACESHVGEGG